MKNFLLAILFVALATTSVKAACANRENSDGSSDFVDDVKCSLSSAGDSISSGYNKTKETVKEGISAVTSSDTFSTLSGWFSSGYDKVKKVAVKTGEVLSDGYDKVANSTVSGYHSLKDSINGQKPNSGEGVLDVRQLESQITTTP